MKATDTRTVASAAGKSSPFFNKAGGQGFFGISRKPIFESESESKDDKIHRKCEGCASSDPFFVARSIQPSLAVGRPDDPYEKEADKVAGEVMNAPLSMQKK